MRLQKTFKIPMYECKIQFVVSKDAKKTVNRLYKKHNTGMIYKDNISGFMLTFSMNHYWIIVDESCLNINCLTHEALHCALAITSDRSIFNEENQCWLLGQICQEIYDYLKSKKTLLK